MMEYEVFIIPTPINSDINEKCRSIVTELQKYVTIYGVGIGETTEEEMITFLQDIIKIAAEKRKWNNATI